MTYTTDNALAILSAGTADWDADTSANFQSLERGFHVTQRAGMAINTGEVLWCSSAGFFEKFDPNSGDIIPMAMAYTAAASGDSMKALAWGIVRSLAINSAILPGAPAWVSAATPGLLVGSSAIQNVPVGLGLPGGSILFHPSLLNTQSFGGGGGGTALAALTDVDTTGVSSGKALAWSDASSKWMPLTIAGGGGGGVDPGSYFTGIQSGGAGWDARFSQGVTITSSNRLGTPVSGSPYNHFFAQPARRAGEGKRYFEFLIGGNTSFLAVGLTGPGGHLKQGDGATIGQRGVGQIGYSPDGNVRVSNQPNNSTVSLATIVSYSTSVYIGVAVDLDLGLLWFRVNTNGTWNNSASANPSSGIGGFDLTHAWAGASDTLIWPGMNAGNTATHAIFLNSGYFGSAVPATFSAWDS
jgi:hypothetical protein